MNLLKLARRRVTRVNPGETHNRDQAAETTESVLNLSKETP